jgi:hypothetical protein
MRQPNDPPPDIKVEPSAFISLADNLSAAWHAPNVTMRARQQLLRTPGCCDDTGSRREYFCGRAGIGHFAVAAFWLAPASDAGSSGDLICLANRLRESAGCRGQVCAHGGNLRRRRSHPRQRRHWRNRSASRDPRRALGMIASGVKVYLASQPVDFRNYAPTMIMRSRRFLSQYSGIFLVG